KLEIGIAKSAWDFAPNSQPGNAVFRVTGDENSMIFNINNNDSSGYILFNSLYDNNIMKILCNGNVGIGTTNPMSTLQVGAGSSKFSIGNSSGADLGYGTSYIGFNASRLVDNTWKFNSDGIHNGGAVISNSIGGDIYFIPVSSNNGSSDISYSDAQLMQHKAMTILSNGYVSISSLAPSTGTNLIQVGTNGILTPISSASAGIGLWQQNGTDIHNTNTTGNVIIGQSLLITSPYYIDYKLSVDGRIVCKKIAVTQIGSWPDDVFDNNYKLLPLNELENYIDTCNHLPDIPSAEEMKKNGLDLAEMNILLLKKVEELTLYIIELKKVLNNIESELLELKQNKK
ncbi:MAG: hypothetical protein COX07_08020, partial [Bacteroidetes bacterium CG23_combo_of_CG06-09_8_20_14_all_32_9]